MNASTQPVPSDTEITRESLLATRLPVGITATRDGIGWNSTTHSLGVKFRGGEFRWTLHWSTGQDVGVLSSTSGLARLFAQMT